MGLVQVMSRLPGPVYVPEAMMTVSPLAAASVAAWMVGYWLGTKSSAQSALEASNNIAPANIALFIFLPFPIEIINIIPLPICPCPQVSTKE
jgi:hypothetical protein